jgi:hypothetical protein
MEGGFVLDRWHVLAGAVDAPVVVPVHPFERRELDVVPCAPRPFTVDELGLVEAVDGFREGVIIGVTDAAYRRRGAGLDEAFGVAY